MGRGQLDHLDAKALAPTALAPAEAIDWGVLGYGEAHRRQLERVASRRRDECPDAIITVEHPHVITIGRRRAARENILDPGDVPVLEVERGGDATYHGPGQVVAYPIVLLRDGERDLHRLLRNLESGLIATLAGFGIQAGREEGKTGVWRDGRKLASIGIACRRWVTFHGVALNVTTDLSYFGRINPCGFDAQVMTSMAAELGRDVDVRAVRNRLVDELASTLSRRLVAPE